MTLTTWAMLALSSRYSWPWPTLFPGARKIQPPMPSRALAFVLVLVLLCSGFVTPEQGVPLVNDGAPNASAPFDLQQQVDGAAVDDQRLADLAAQVHAETLTAETPAEMQALLKDCAQPPLAEQSTPRYRPYVALERAAPYLDGPQRPPCATALIA